LSSRSKSSHAPKNRLYEYACQFLILILKKKTQNYGAAAIGEKNEKNGKEGKNKGVGASLQEALQIILADRRILLTGLSHSFTNLSYLLANLSSRLSSQTGAFCSQGLKQPL
jgi:hypothetical protein